MSLLDELKRRNVFKVGAAYLIVAWLAVQVVSIAFPAFDAPPWALRAFILLALLGFPLALAMAWAFETTPEGVRRDTSPAGNRRMALIVAAFAVLALAWYFVGMPALRPNQELASSPATTTRPAAAPAAPAKSIAVLPFADMSPGHDNEFLGDGIAEEILNALAHVEGLKVAGRTSSFHFKGRNEDLKTIGSALGVAHVLEGSVRRQGDKVRITAQLVRSADGYHLWSENYDGDMKDVFALQERIARAVTDSLKVVLQAGGATPLVQAGTHNPDAYALYLQASLIFNRRQGDRFPEGMAKLKQAIALDPSYARAWARLASMHALSGNYRSEEPAQMLVEVEAAAKHASALDPKLGEPYAATGLALVQLRHSREGRAAFVKALELEPDDITTNVWNGITLEQFGYRREGDASLDRALALDPMLPIALLWRAMSHSAQGELDEADRQLQLAEESNLAFVGLGRGHVLMMRGDRTAAAEQTTRALRVLATDFDEETNTIFGRACVGDISARPEALLRVNRYLASKPHPVAGAAAYVLLCVGEVERALELFASAPTSNDSLVSAALFRGRWPEALASKSFPAVARRVGWAELWEAYGPPDVCRKADNGDWLCHVGN
ncbi:MAG: hypothetical protein ABI588_06480 [Arenimonas sp.]